MKLLVQIAGDRQPNYNDESASLHQHGDPRQSERAEKNHVVVEGLPVHFPVTVSDHQGWWAGGSVTRTT
jgi:hypothetical protein